MLVTLSYPQLTDNRSARKGGLPRVLGYKNIIHVSYTCIPLIQKENVSSAANY